MRIDVEEELIYRLENFRKRFNSLDKDIQVLIKKLNKDGYRAGVPDNDSSILYVESHIGYIENQQGRKQTKISQIYSLVEIRNIICDPYQMIVEQFMKITSDGYKEKFIGRDY